MVRGSTSSDLELRGSSIVSLQNDNEMDDYTYRVAGSVGEFWTRMSMSHLVFHGRDPEEMLKLGIRFGKALQLINILRDIPSDLNIGRCYIPSVRLASLDMKVSDLKSEESMEKFRPLYNEYLDLACKYLDSAADYISLIPASSPASDILHASGHHWLEDHSFDETAECS